MTLHSIYAIGFVLTKIDRNVNIETNRSCDVLIVGGGSVGLRAAIEAHGAGAHVLIISKSKKADPHAVLARDGINAACTMDPYEVRLGKDRLFEDDIYTKLFDTRHVKEYLLFFWLHRIVSSFTREDSRYRYAKWLILNFLWSKILTYLRRSTMRDIFIHVVQRPKTHYLIVRRLRTLVRIVTKAALAFYRLNRKIKGTVMSEQDFFKHKNLHIGFRDWWASQPVARNKQVEKYAQFFVKSLDKMEMV